MMYFLLEWLGSPHFIELSVAEKLSCHLQICSPKGFHLLTFQQ